jgi:hypothetical protein
MIDLRRAEEQNQWLAAHWNDGVPLRVLDIDVGDALKYTLLEVLTTLWLRHAADIARQGHAAPQSMAPQDERVMTVVNAAQALAEATGLSPDEIVQAVTAALQQKADVARQAGATAGADVAEAVTDSQPANAAPQEAATGLAVDSPKRHDVSGEEEVHA